MNKTNWIKINYLYVLQSTLDTFFHISSGLKIRNLDYFLNLVQFPTLIYHCQKRHVCFEGSTLQWKFKAFAYYIFEVNYAYKMKIYTFIYWLDALCWTFSRILLDITIKNFNSCSLLVNAKRYKFYAKEINVKKTETTWHIKCLVAYWYLMHKIILLELFKKAFTKHYPVKTTEKKIC